VKRIAIARAELRGFGMRYLTFRPRINVSIGRDHEELEYLEKGPRIPARSSAETNRAESRPGGIGPRARNIENGLQIRAAMAFRYSTRTEGRGKEGWRGGGRERTSERQIVFSSQTGKQARRHI